MRNINSEILFLTYFTITHLKSQCIDYSVPGDMTDIGSVDNVMPVLGRLFLEYFGGV